MGRVRTERTTVEQMIWTARCAVRLRQEAAKDTIDRDTCISLLRAAERYSGKIAELADEMLREAGQ